MGEFKVLLHLLICSWEIMPFVAPCWSHGGICGWDLARHWNPLDCTGGCCTCSLADRVVFKDSFPFSVEDAVVLLRHCGIWCVSLVPSLGAQPSATVNLSFTAAWRS